MIGNRYRTALSLPQVRTVLAVKIAAQPGEWMSIPAWSRWFRWSYRLRGRNIGDPRQ